MQELLVALIVLGCTLYAAWALLPPGWRRPLVSRVAAWPVWPAPMARWLQAKAGAGAGCGGGCKGCDSPAAPPTSGNERPMHFHPPRRR